LGVRFRQCAVWGLDKVQRVGIRRVPFLFDALQLRGNLLAVLNCRSADGAELGRLGVSLFLERGGGGLLGGV